MTTITSVALLVTIRDLSMMLSRSVASLERDQTAGRLPTPMKIGSSKYWKRAEILAWVDAGCPDRAMWEARNQLT